MKLTHLRYILPFCALLVASIGHARPTIATPPGSQSDIRVATTPTNAPPDRPIPIAKSTTTHTFGYTIPKGEQRKIALNSQTIADIGVTHKGIVELTINDAANEITVKAITKGTTLVVIHTSISENVLLLLEVTTSETAKEAFNTRLRGINSVMLAEPKPAPTTP